MPRRFALIALALSAALSAAAFVTAQQPAISNAQVTVQPAGSPFARWFASLVAEQPSPAWIGYSVPALPREGTTCCFTSGTTHLSGNVVVSDGAAWVSGCRLEPGSPAAGSPAAARPPAGPIKLEGANQLLVMVRVADRRVERIRVFSEGCPLDAGGLPVRWIEGVPPAESVALLASYIPAEADKRDRLVAGALTALALHAASEAGATLERLARTHGAAAVRGEALFWIAQRGDAAAERTIAAAIDTDPSSDVRKRGVFALSQLKDDAAVPALLRVAKAHEAAAVRGEAIFWLGQKAGARAARDITDRIEQDPDTEVKKRAVFALSQLPRAEGVPLLIQVARTNPNPAVKKQAIFWLGQSKDPRALDFFAEILK